MNYDLSKFPAGLQRVESGYVQDGDICSHLGAVTFVIVDEIGVNIERYLNFGASIYRPIPVAKPGDLDGVHLDKLPEGVTIADKAKTYDDEKPPLAQLPWAAMRELSMVQLYGHKKYKDFNNYRKGMEISRNLSCAMRHISEYMDGNDLDTESGRSHLAHALCRLAFVIQNVADGTAIDDRYRKS